MSRQQQWGKLATSSEGEEVSTLQCHTQTTMATTPYLSRQFQSSTNLTVFVTVSPLHVHVFLHICEAQNLHRAPLLFQQTSTDRLSV